MTRQYSRDTIAHFPDNNLQYLKNPHIFKTKVVDQAAHLPDTVRQLYARDL